MSLFGEVRSSVDALQKACPLPPGASMEGLEDYFNHLAIHAHKVLSLLFRSRLVSKEKAGVSWGSGKRNRGKNRREKGRPPAQQPASSSTPTLSSTSLRPPSPSPPLLPSPLTETPLCPPSDQTALLPKKPTAPTVPVLPGLVQSDPRDANPERTVRKNLPIAISSVPKAERQKQKKERRATTVAARPEERNSSASALTPPDPIYPNSGNLTSCYSEIAPTRSKPPVSDPPKTSELHQIPMVRVCSKLIPCPLALDPQLKFEVIRRPKTQEEIEACSLICGDPNQPTLRREYVDPTTLPPSLLPSIYWALTEHSQTQPAPAPHTLPAIPTPVYPRFGAPSSQVPLS